MNNESKNPGAHNFSHMVLIAQNKCAEDMSKSLSHWRGGKAIEDPNPFEHITVEGNNWIPYHYMVQANTIAHYGEKNGKKLAEQQEKANKFAAIAKRNMQLYDQTLQIVREHPRVKYSKVNWDMGTVRCYGTDAAPYCKDMERALELFATFANGTPFYPNKGEDWAQQALEQCN